MNLDNVSSIFYNNKEVISIKNLLNDEYIYQKDSTPIELIFTGQELSQYSTAKVFEGNNILIDYGDGTIAPYEQNYNHTYAQTDTYTIQIYKVTGLKYNCFRNCTGLTSISIPNSVTSLESNCFYNCTGLTSISIPNSVTSLGPNCFYKCTGLTSIVIPDTITSLGNHCFFLCTGLTLITIPNNVTSLGQYCFYGCRSLTSINIPNSVTNLGDNCFNSCTGLISVVISSSVTSLGDSCFDSCFDLTEIVLNWESSSEILTYNSGWINDCTSFEHFIIPEGTTDLYVDKGYPIELLKENVLFDSISLDIDKNILSSVDGDSTGLSAQLMYNGEYSSSEGEVVYFFIVDSDDNLVEDIGVGITDNNGLAVCSNDYIAQGIGDITIQAIVINGSDTYTDTKNIEDCIYYNSNVITSAITPNISLPPDFEVKYSVSVASNGGGTGFLRFNDASGFYTGKGASANKNIYLNNQLLEEIPSLQTYYEYTMTYQNGVATLTRNGNTVSESIGSLTSLYLINSSYNTYIKGVKIKPIQSITVSATADILSFIDEDSTTLTATLPAIPNGKIIRIYRDDILIASEPINSQGQVSYTYTSQGIGDTVFKFKYGDIEETKTIEDCLNYDASSSSGVSNYDTSLLNGSLSYDTTQSAYKVTKSSNGYGILFDNSVNLPVNAVITADMMVINGSGNHHIAHGIGLYDLSESLGVGCQFVKHHSLHEYALLTFNTSGTQTEWGKDSNVSTSSNTWYHIEMKITNTIVTAKMYLNDTIISSHTHSNTVNSGDNNKLAFFQYVVNGTPYFKNIKVKPLNIIDISATKDTIISSETTTMTATLPSLESGKSIKIYKDGILVDTKQTDSQGQVTYTYTGQGVGDVSFEFKSGYWSGTKTIEDYTKIYALDSSTQYKNNSGSYGSTVIANGVYSGGASFLSETFDGSQGDWTVKMDIKFTGSSCGVGLQYGVVHNRERSIFKINVGGQVGYNNSPNGWYGIGSFGLSSNIWYPVTFEKKGNTITCYCNNLNFSTSAWEFTNSATLSVGTDQWTGSGSPASFRNLRIHLE